MAWLLWERAPLSRYLRRRQRGFHETDLQVAGRVLAEPGKEARAGVGYAVGGAQNPITFGPFADGEEDLAHRTLDARPVRLMLAGNLLRQTLQPSSKPGKLSRSGMANVASGASMFPLRSTSTVSIPTSAAPLMSEIGSLPTWIARSLPTPLTLSASSKILGSGFSTPTTPEAITPSKYRTQPRSLSTSTSRTSQFETT